jgi:hypothetical protein
MALFLFKTHDVSETGLCLRLQVEPNLFGPLDGASSYLRTSVRVRVTLRLTVSQSVCLGVEPRPGLMTRY